MIIPRKIPAEIWAWYNLKGDCAILALHFFVGIILLTLIELEVYSLFDWCPRFGCRSKDSQRRGLEPAKDDDVMAEEKRVEAQTNDSNAHDCIRVCNFQKEYNTFCGAPIKAVK